MQHKLNKVILMALGDLAIINGAFLLAIILKFESFEPLALYLGDLRFFLFLNICHLLVFGLCGVYRRLWRYAGLKELIYLSLCVCVSLMSVMLYDLWGKSSLPITFYIIFGFVLGGATIGSRFFYRIYHRLVRRIQFAMLQRKSEEEIKPIRTMLVGGGEAASIIIQDLRSSTDSKRAIVAIADDDTKKLGATLGGVPITGTTAEIPSLVEAHQITEIILTMPSASKRRISEILDICKTTECKLKLFKGIDKTLDQKPGSSKIRNVHIEDLLGRDEIVLDNKSLLSFIQDKTVLVTGGGGSIGSELCRQISALSPERLIILDIYENNAYDLQNELLRNGFDPTKLSVLIGSVRDKRKLRDIFKKYRPNIVFHAAAHKHVPLMENAPEEAVKNNVFGTLNTALLAKEYGVERFVLISTDKAVNPTNVMGATKRICEMIIQSVNSIAPHTEYVAVRFGNVLGSNGSVIPLFKRQLEAGGPLTVTHPDIIRYFMTIPEAVRLVLQASTMATGGEIFVLDMGKPVKILDLAKNFIRLSGFKEGEDIEITFTGLRPGEKLYEELLMSEEGLAKTNSEKIFVAQPLYLDYNELTAKLNMLEHCLNNQDRTKQVLAQIVETYKIDRAYLDDPTILDEDDALDQMA
ncbi:MAG: polysaccharide biosynthesis protein [Cellulosilyticaceae bacterium]